ncbi:MAG: PqqD family protein [Bacteroidales bacterium]|nr:PqqD family protein [Bacteroidales bacterium]
MIIKEGFKLRTVLGEYIVVAEGAEQMKFKKILNLNASAAYLWQQILGKEFTVGDLADLLVGQYCIDRNRALEDAAAIAETWKSQGVLAE